MFYQALANVAVVGAVSISVLIGVGGCASNAAIEQKSSWSIIQERAALMRMSSEGVFYNSSPLVINVLDEFVSKRPKLANAHYHNAIMLIQYAPDSAISSIYFASSCSTGLCLSFSYSSENGYQSYPNKPVSSSICSQNEALAQVGKPESMPLMNPGDLSLLLTCIRNDKITRFARTGGTEMDLSSFIKGSPLKN